MHPNNWMAALVPTWSPFIFRQDAAGMNLASALMARGGAGWTPLKACPISGGSHATWVGDGAPPPVAAHLWIIEEKLTRADHLDRRWASGKACDADFEEEGSHLRPFPDEVFFLSRHASASGAKCLTVHSIGNFKSPPPGSLPEEPPEYGGRHGRCPPPSRRTGQLLRAVKEASAAAGLLKRSDGKKQRAAAAAAAAAATTAAAGGGREESCGKGGIGSGRGDFSVCPEATHHGPWLETPCCFVEIGSANGDWQRPDAAAVWAGVLHDAVLLGGGAGPCAAGAGAVGSSSEAEGVTDQRPIVLVGIGGGHYAPRVMDVVTATAGGGGGGGGREVVLGHIVPSYALDFDGSDIAGPGAGGRWRHAVAEAVEASRRTWRQGSFAGDRFLQHPDGMVEVVGLVDKKAFRASELAALLELLRELGVRSALTKAEVVAC